MRILHNEEIFDPQSFGESKIIHQSQFRLIQFNPRKPSYLGYDL